MTNSHTIVAITGGTGSLGTALTRYLFALDPTIVVRVISRGEHRQAAMQQTFQADRDRLRFFIGDVRDYHRLLLAFHDADIVIHAAALKRQDLLEYNVYEGVATNVHGTYQVTRACADSGVKRCIFISSDKACQPCTLYGHTKAVGECLAIQANAYNPHGTSYDVVRYGNVMGSQGSVLPFWQQCLRDGKALPVTDASATRFWIDLQEAVRFVWWAAQRPTRGYLYVPYLPAFDVADLAVALGAGDISPEVHIVGRRPAEKVHERLLTDEEQVRALWTDCPIFDEWRMPPCCYALPPIARSWEDLPMEPQIRAQFLTPYDSEHWKYRLNVQQIRERLHMA